MKIELYKINSRNKKQLWIGEIKGDSYTITFGQEDGKMQEKTTTVTKGKNIGKANETTPAQQALAELESAARKKIDTGYINEKNHVFTTVNAKQVKKVVADVPAPMLANQANKHTKKIVGKQIFIQPKLDGCLSGDTIVELKNNGNKTLKEIFDNEIEDYIKSYDIKNKKIVYSKILNSMKNLKFSSKDTKWYKITLEDGATIKATGNHLFFLQSILCFRRCDELKIGDKLFLN